MRFNPLSWLRPSSAVGPAEQKASAAGYVVSAWHVGKPVWTDHDYEKLAKEAYVLNAIGFACVKLIAKSAAHLPVILRQGEDEADDHPALALLARPNPVASQAWFLESVYAFLLLSGNSYVEAVGPKSPNTPPRELWTLRPDRMQAIPGSKGIAQGYEYSAKGARKRFAVDQHTGRGEVLHIREFHPTDDWYGLARVQPAAYGVDRHNAAGSHNTALLQNGARPGGALSFKPIKDADGGETFAPKEVVQAAHDRLLDRYAGPENAGRPMVFGSPVEWTEMGLSPKDMDFAESKLDAARDICAAFGVPIEMLLPGQSTYNNKAEAKLAFYEDTVLPLAGHVLSDLNAWLLPRFGKGDLALEVDEDSVSALEPRREYRRKSTVELFEAGIIDVDEARERLQYGPRPSEAVGKVDGSVVTALVAAMPQTGPDPLTRYLKSVGLYDPAKTPEQIAQDVLAMLEDGDSEADLLAAGGAAPPPETQEEGAG